MPHADRAGRPPAAGKVKHRGTIAVSEPEGPPAAGKKRLCAANADPLRARGRRHTRKKAPSGRFGRGFFTWRRHRKWLMLFP